MNSEYIIIERELVKTIIEDNKKLKEELKKYKQPQMDQPMEKQISIEEYIKTLKKEKKKNE